jgi:hypothetical protein
MVEEFAEALQPGTSDRNPLVARVSSLLRS